MAMVVVVVVLVKPLLQPQRSRPDTFIIDYKFRQRRIERVRVVIGNNSLGHATEKRACRFSEHARDRNHVRLISYALFKRIPLVLLQIETFVVRDLHKVFFTSKDRLSQL